jgi:hypothetical protein
VFFREVFRNINGSKQLYPITHGNMNFFLGVVFKYPGTVLRPDGYRVNLRHSSERKINKKKEGDNFLHVHVI